MLQKDRILDVKIAVHKADDFGPYQTPINVEWLKLPISAKTKNVVRVNKSRDDLIVVFGSD